jgi:hypothetical protein
MTLNGRRITTRTPDEGQDDTWPECATFEPSEEKIWQSKLDVILSCNVTTLVLYVPHHAYELQNLRN